MRVLFLGGTRFIGLGAVRILAARGHEIGVFHRGETNAELPEGVACFLGDRRRLGDSKATLRAFAPDVIVDMFAMTEAHARATVETLAGAARRFVVASSADVYRVRDRLWRVEAGPPDPVALTEDAPLRVTRFPYRAEATRTDEWLYDYDKIPVEEIARRDLDATILRLPAVYGPGDYRKRVWDYLKPIVEGRAEIPIDSQQATWRWTRGFVTNVAEAIALVVEDDRAAGRVYNVGESDAPTELAWAEAIARAASYRGRIVAVPRAALSEAKAKEAAKFDFSHDWVIDTRKIRNELGYWDTVDRDEAIRATVARELEESSGPKPMLMIPLHGKRPPSSA